MKYDLRVAKDEVKRKKLGKRLGSPAGGALCLPGLLPTPEGGFLARCWAGRSSHQPLFAGGDFPSPFQYAETGPSSVNLSRDRQTSALQ